MLRALFSGVAGLKTHQTAMDVIGNNIANVNTYGFKASRTTFKDVFYQTLSGSSDAGAASGGVNASQIGCGSMLASIDVLHTRSSFASTNNAMDVFINGEGYLIARDGSGSEYYTRVGTLDFDGSGNLVDKNGNFICGYPILRDSTGNIVYKTTTPVAGQCTIGSGNINFGTANGAMLNDYEISIADSTTPGATIDTASKKITVNLDIAGGADIADLQTALRGITGGPSGTDFTQITTTGTLSAGSGTVAGGVNEQTNTPMLDTSGDPKVIKKPGTLTDSNGDGLYDSESNDVIELKNIAIGVDGTITGTDTNGEVVPIGQICLATVPNPAALIEEGNSYFSAVNNTGEITYSAAGEGVTGQLTAGGLEMSNVDLSTEFANMIITQRGFQANSRIITVGDEMLEELVNMKR
ncbi:MAG: flagellar hook protein FlgE [Anaerofustis sp.]